MCKCINSKWCTRVKPSWTKNQKQANLDKNSHHCGQEKAGFAVGLGKRCVSPSHAHTKAHTANRYYCPRDFFLPFRKKKQDFTTHTEQLESCRVTHLEFPTAAALPETSGTQCSSLAEERRNKVISANAQVKTSDRETKKTTYKMKIKVLR